MRFLLVRVIENAMKMKKKKSQKKISYLKLYASLSSWPQTQNMMRCRCRCWFARWVWGLGMEEKDSKLARQLLLALPRFTNLFSERYRSYFDVVMDSGVYCHTKFGHLGTETNLGVFGLKYILLLVLSFLRLF